VSVLIHPEKWQSEQDRNSQDRRGI
jgi:hypothetical protein